MGAPLGKGISPSNPDTLGPPSTLTRTETTAGFTLSTISANPTGRCRPWACATGPPRLEFKLKAETASRTPMPRPATPASSARRWADGARDFRSGVGLSSIETTPDLDDEG